MLENNKEIGKIKEKKYDKFAIASFVLSLILVILTLFIKSSYSIFRNGIISIGIVIFGVWSLYRIKKNESLKGKLLAIIGISVVVVYILAVLLSVLSIGL